MSSEPPSVKRPQAVSGYITKQASSFPWNWKRRWACYDAKTMTLSYFEGKDDGEGYCSALCDPANDTCSSVGRAPTRVTARKAIPSTSRQGFSLRSA